MHSKVGDTVVFAKYAPVMVEYLGKKVAVVSESEIYFIDRTVKATE